MRKLLILLCVLLPFGVTAGQIIPATLATCPVPSIGHWKFNESDTTTTAVDSVGGNDGTLISMTGNEWEAGHLNNALHLPGATGDGVDIGDIAAIDTATQLSVCAWVNHDTITTDDGIFSSMDASSTAGARFMRDDSGFVFGRTDIYTIVIHDSADADSVVIEGATNSSPSGTWTHVCFTYEANTAGGLRLYVGETEDANSPVDTTGISSIDAGALIKLLGDRALSAGEFDGLLDNVKIHGGVWSPAQISADYNGGIGCE